MRSSAPPQTAYALAPEDEQWRERRKEFQALADEHWQMVRALVGTNNWLRAFCEYNSDATRDESKFVEKGALCLLYRFESGVWQLSGGPIQDLKVRFETLATRAGLALRPPHGASGFNFWLHHLCCYLRRTQSELFGRRDAGPLEICRTDFQGEILDVCRASATFCSWLEAKALGGQRVAAERINDNPQNERQAFVMPKLIEKGWSINQLAVQAEVDFHTVNDYLKGKTNPNRSTRKQLADALGVAVGQLP